MRKIQASRLQEILFGSANKAESARISKLEKQKLIRRIAPKIYTSNMEEDSAIIILRNWYHILANQYPDALLSHRSALEFRPTPAGHVYLTYTYTNNHLLPGLFIHLLKGPSAVEGDKTFFENLRVAQDARAFLENLQTSRKTGEESKTLGQATIEERLDTILRTRGEKGLNELRDTARALAPLLGMEKQFAKLNTLISALLSTGPSRALHSAVAKARSLGEPFDPGRIDLFENLYQLLAGHIFPSMPDQNSSLKAYRNFAFYEGYFSNYIEGTEFTIEEAKEIILTDTPLPARNDDSHDILGTYHIVSDRNEMSRVPPDAKAMLDLLRDRHALLLRSRTTKNPGQFKDRNNRAGKTEFVDWQLVNGTLKKGFEWYGLLQHPFARAAYMMFLISEVHPFIDGNGRIARVMMNAELSAQGLAKIIIPTVYREDYIGALKKFTNQRDPTAYVRMLQRAWRFSSYVFGEDLDTMEGHLVRCNAFLEPKGGIQLKKIAVMIAGTSDWTEGVPIAYGRDIRLTSSAGNFAYKIYNTAGLAAVFEEGDKANLTIVRADHAAISKIDDPLIAFVSHGGEDIRIEFEVLG